MNNSEEKKIELVESLMEEKAYEELSSGEQELVLEVVDSQEEYTRMRKLGRHLSKGIELQQAIPEPDPGILSEIKKRHFSKPKKQYNTGRLKIFFGWKMHVPVYQVVGLAVIVLILFLANTKRSVQFVDRPVMVENVVHDTIRTQPEKDTVYIDRYIVKKVSPDPQAKVSLEEPIATSDAEDMVKAEDYLSMVNHHKGFSLKEKEYLLNLTVSNE